MKLRATLMKALDRHIRRSVQSLYPVQDGRPRNSRWLIHTTESRRPYSKKPALEAADVLLVEGQSWGWKGMLVLDGDLSDVSNCLQRGYGAFLTALICFVGFSFIVTAILRLNRDANAGKAQASTGRIGFYALSGLLVLTIVAGSVVFGVARNRTVLFVENDQLVERGCVKLRSYEDRFPLKDVGINYEFHPKGRIHRLRFQPSPTSRTLLVTLNSSEHLGNLAVIAPFAMSDYVVKLQQLSRPIPALLK